MSQFPQKKVLTDISHIQSLKSQASSKAAINNRFQRINQVFKFSPTHSRQINVPEISFENSSRSKYRSNVNCLEQLNSIFKCRNITNKRIFFNDDLTEQKQEARSKSKINQDIEHSIVYIQNLKKKRIYTESTQQMKTQFPKIGSKQKQSFIEAIGLQLPELKTKRDYHSRFVTQPATSESTKKEKKKKMEPKGLFSYLQRDFIDKKVRTLTETKLVNYAKNPNDRNFHRIMLEKSRNLIKNSVQNNYREVSKINQILNEESKRIIEVEINSKKKKYERDYLVRKNVPYFSFLTLKQEQKKSVLKSIRRKKSIS